MFVVYVLKSTKFAKTYVGFINNLERRLNEHNKGFSTYSKKYKPWEVIYSEIYDTKEDAVKREKYLKSASGRRLVLKKLF
jgi:putative endonuclease